MAVMQPSKGGSNLAQSFLGNTATQAAPLPQITAPQGFSTPQPAPMPAPQPIGTMAPPEMRKEWYNTMTGEAMPNYRPRPWMSSMKDMGIIPAQREVPVAPAAQPQMAPQPSRYQQIAQAINDRAIARLNSGGR